MDCNRDEALRAKEIAEGKFESADYNGARNFALRAQSLYPGLEHIQHMIAALDVYIAAQDHIGGDSKWYKILGVDPDADVGVVMKQYRKLALLLHPDKNKSKGADGAFKLISEARDVLCNSERRSTFDEKRTNSVANNPVKASGGSSSNRSTAKKPRASNRKSSTSKGAASTNTMPSQKHTYPMNQTFWTLCKRCMIQHEYLRLFLHQNVCCPYCQSAYCAFEFPPPTQFQKNFNTQYMHPNQFQPNPAQAQAQAEYNQTSSNWNQFTEQANEAPTAAQEAFETSRMEREATLNATHRDRQEWQKGRGGGGGGGGGAELKRRRVDEDPTREKSEGA